MVFFVMYWCTSSIWLQLLPLRDNRLLGSIPRFQWFPCFISISFHLVIFIWILYTLYFCPIIATIRFVSSFSYKKDCVISMIVSLSLPLPASCASCNSYWSRYGLCIVSFIKHKLLFYYLNVQNKEHLLK